MVCLVQKAGTGVPRQREPGARLGGRVERPSWLAGAPCTASHQTHKWQTPRARQQDERGTDLISFVLHPSARSSERGAA
eukprot:2936490-Prymnesium_polylepis.1